MSNETNTAVIIKHLSGNLHNLFTLIQSYSRALFKYHLFASFLLNVQVNALKRLTCTQNVRYLLPRWARYTIRICMSAGETPDILPACPKFAGRILLNF